MLNHHSHDRWPGVGHLARLVLTFLLVLVVASPAFAQDIPRFSSQVTDLTQNQVLASGRSQIQSALQDLLNRQNIQLFVLFVDTTGARSVTDFAHSPGIHLETARTRAADGGDDAGMTPMRRKNSSACGGRTPG